MLSQKLMGVLQKEVSVAAKPLRLAIVVVGEDPVVQKFIAQKKRAAEYVGISVRIYPFPATITTNELRKKLAEIVHEKRNTGVIVQLPLPPHINAQYILNAVPPEKDVDMLSARSLGNFVTGKDLIIPPVVGAVRAFFAEYEIDYKNKYIVVIGAGTLVGKPVALWLLQEKATFSVIRSTTETPQKFLLDADIIISGIGQPKYITADMIKKDVVIIDAGTSESEGKLSGDADFESVAAKAAFITPVPGGVGPVTVAILFQNLLALSQKQ